MGAVAALFSACDGKKKTPQAGAELAGASAEAAPNQPWPPKATFEQPCLTGVPLNSRASAPVPVPTLYEMIDPQRSGLDFLAKVEKDNPLARLYRSGMASGAIAAGDVDGDGWVDVMCVSGSGKNRLFRQLPTGGIDFRFEDITQRASGGREGADQLDGGALWGTGLALADVNNDGRLDIYVGNYEAPNQLFINQGNGADGVPVFKEAARDWGVDVNNATHTPTFADVDNDGDLDLYICTNRFEDPKGLREAAIVEFKEGRPSLKPGWEKYYEFWFQDFDHWGVQPNGQEDFLFRNEGGKFVDVSKQAGIKGRGDGLAANWCDYDLDGHIDLWVSNDFISPDQFLRNNGDGTFKDIAHEVAPHISWFSMGADTGDLNNDGLPDILTADMSATNHFKQKVTMGAMGGQSFKRAVTSLPPQYMRNALLVNTGLGRFMEAGFLADLESSDWTWTVKIADLDCDGWQDVFFTNGTPREMNDSDATLTKEQLAEKPEWEYVKDRPARKEKDLAYKNHGHFEFEDVSDAWGLGIVGVSYGAAHADFDHDGDLDLVVMNIDDPVSLFRNRGTGGHAAVFALKGTKSNKQGIGAHLRIETASGIQIRQVTAISGYLSGNDPAAHFGLGQDDTIKTLIVKWPSGLEQRFENLKADMFYTVTEEPSALSPQPPAPEPAPMFVRAEGIQFTPHKEQPFDDFQLQPLLPNQLSQYGPGLAFGDVNGDGADDVYLGGAGGASGGQTGELRLAERGQFTAQWVDSLRADKECEDMGAVFFDADSDGDLDLFVVSGSYEFAPGDPRQKDRLYINDGKGDFSRAAADALPDLTDAGSCASASDFDHDGDLDLFVGSRVVPGEYPRTPESRLLRNDRGTFVEVTDELAPGLKKSGLVTGGLWSDADGDGWTDLLVTIEWGPVKFFRNARGRLEDKTAESGLEVLSGWWNAITGGDVDGDGDIDYAVMNQGHNSKYHADSQHPIHIYYGDYFGQGEKQLVEAEFEKDTLFPVRGRSCSSRAMPAIKDKFKSYRAFAAATVEQIYSQEALQKADRWTVTTLDSGVMINDGKGAFAFKPLPHLGQISPGFGCALVDVDADTRPDLVLVNNFFGPQSETGRYDGGMGWVLRGKGDGTFEEVWPKRSGFLVPGDGKALCVGDLNDDQRPDLLASQNNGPVLGFYNQCRGNKPLAVRLRGGAGNPTAAGAVVTVRLSDGKSQTQEIYAGGGYLSQNSPTLFFGLGSHETAQKIEVRWPGGAVQTLDTPDVTSGSVKIAQR